MWDLSSLMKDQTHAPCSPLGHQEAPYMNKWSYIVFIVVYYSYIFLTVVYYKILNIVPCAI